jgi:predicted transcriptional regulator
MNNEALITLTSDIVAAHVSHNSVTVGDLPTLIQSVFQALANIGEPAPVISEKGEPAVSARASVKPDAVICMECGFKGKTLKRHLMSEHSITPQEYRIRWQLPSNHPMVAPSYRAQRAELAKSIGLGRKKGEKVGSRNERKLLKIVASADQ